jgi:hypothetical protein
LAIAVLGDGFRARRWRPPFLRLTFDVMSSSLGPSSSDAARLERMEEARKDKAAAAKERTVTCVACQGVVLRRESHLTSYGVVCARCHDED